MSEEERFLKGIRRQQDLPVLQIFGNEHTELLLQKTLKGLSFEECALSYTRVTPYREYECNGVKFIPLTASHRDRDDEMGLIYIVETEGVSFLYAVDSGPYNDETKAMIASQKYDVIIMEQTFGYTKRSPWHMDWNDAMEAAEFFEKADVWKERPRIYWTHMSPHRTPVHDDLTELLEGTDITPAYDGLKIRI